VQHLSMQRGQGALLLTLILMSSEWSPEKIKKRKNTDRGSEGDGSDEEQEIEEEELVPPV